MKIRIFLLFAAIVSTIGTIFFGSLFFQGDLTHFTFLCGFLSFVFLIIALVDIILLLVGGDEWQD